MPLSARCIYKVLKIRGDQNATRFNYILPERWSPTQGRIKYFWRPYAVKTFPPLISSSVSFRGGGGGGITPQTESNTTPPSPKTEITNILFYILNFASIIKFKI